MVKQEKNNVEENSLWWADINTNINNITPMDAMKFLFELKENMKKDN